MSAFHRIREKRAFDAAKGGMARGRDCAWERTGMGGSAWPCPAGRRGGAQRGGVPDPLWQVRRGASSKDGMPETVPWRGA